MAVAGETAKACSFRIIVTADTGDRRVIVLAHLGHIERRNAVGRLSAAQRYVLSAAGIVSP
ncbi:hypothetical protein WI664_15055 [Vibrio cholerae]